MQLSYGSTGVNRKGCTRKGKASSRLILDRGAHVDLGDRNITALPVPALRDVHRLRLKNLLRGKLRFVICISQSG